jgi:hypothetical protein
MTAPRFRVGPGPALDLEEMLFACLKAGRAAAPAVLWEAWRFERVRSDVLPSILASVWSTAEYPQTALTDSDWLALYEAAQYAVDGQKAEPPGAPTILYRGTPKSRRRRMAWTGSREVAGRFAGPGLRNEIGQVWVTTAPPAAILARITERDEDEYVINTRGLAIAVAKEEVHMNRHQLTPEQRSSRARLAALSRWANTTDRTAATQPARDALAAQWATASNPEAAKRAHMTRLAFESSKARGRKK